jgi:hypothetical protein
MKWVQHVQRMNDNGFYKTALNMNLEDKVREDRRKGFGLLGRNRHGWLCLEANKKNKYV